ncbi:hypothetical protein Acsp03_36780 [Actinomadura sp. NBRC 104412]|nr:hypothetical protein Acsp03_36780 [Actinomadura sp. NBRC 104412]
MAGLSAARAAGRPCGTAVGGATAAAEAIAQGFGFVVAGNDTTLLAKAATALVQEVRKVPVASGPDEGRRNG